MNEQDAKVVRSVAVASLSVQNSELAKRVQKAMTRAVLFCGEKGYSTAEENTPVLRYCMDAARHAVKEAWPGEADVEAILEVALTEVTRN